MKTPIKTLLSLVLLALVHVATEAADRFELPEGAVWTGRQTVHEFEEFLSLEEARLEIERKESPFLLSEFPTPTRWKEIRSEFTGMTQVRIYRQNDIDPTSYILGLVAEDREGRLSLIYERRGYQAKVSQYEDSQAVEAGCP